MAKEILEKMETYMPETVFAVPTSFKKAIENFRSSLEVKKE